MGVQVIDGKLYLTYCKPEFTFLSLGGWGVIRLT